MPRISFADSASTGQVTGSCVEVDGRILIECGMSQGGNMLDNYIINNSNFNFKVKNIDYVFLLHAHQDHIGRTPLLFKRNGCPTIIVPKGNKQLLKKMLRNSCMILNGEAESLTKRAKSKKRYKPLYEQQDVDDMMANVEEFEIGKEYKLEDGISFKMLHSQHVPFGASLVLTIDKKKLYYTSDLGNIKYESYYCEKLQTVRKADLVISECTYANKERSSNSKTQRKR